MATQIQPTPRPAVEVIERAQREREFFNRHTDPSMIPDEVLRVPAILDAIPREVSEYVPVLQGRKVCEIGCGYGVISSHFAQQGAEVWGIDVSDSNVSVAERTVRVNGVEGRVSLHVMQGECLNFADNSFDLVFGNAVLHHLDIAAAAREICRVLKPGGAAIFREPLGENCLLEWARTCPLRSTSHRHSEDEHSLRYRDVELLRSVFPAAVLRESEFLSVLAYLWRRGEVGMIAIPRWERMTQRLTAVDEWLLKHVPLLRPLASYSVVSMLKPGALQLQPNVNSPASE